MWIAARAVDLSLFFHGEDSVTDDLSPFIDAARREEQKYFLATQQVDERAARGAVRPLHAGGGRRGIGWTPNPEATAMLFDGLRRQIDASVAPGATIQWDFSDAEPWHLRLANGNTEAAPGRVERPDLTFHCRLVDWVDIAAGRTEPWRALLAGKVRPSGKLRMLIRSPKLFG